MKTTIETIDWRPMTETPNNGKFSDCKRYLVTLAHPKWEGIMLVPEVKTLPFHSRRGWLNERFEEFYGEWYVEGQNYKIVAWAENPEPCTKYLDKS